MKNQALLTSEVRQQEKRVDISYTSTKKEINKKIKENFFFRTEGRSKLPLPFVLKFSAKIMVAGGICARLATRLHIVPSSQSIDFQF